MVSNIKIEIWGFNLSDILFVNYDWTCDDGDDDDDDDGVDDGIAVDVEVFKVALGRHSGSTFHRRGLSGAAVG